jgi:hypothetical protein
MHSMELTRFAGARRGAALLIITALLLFGGRAARAEQVINDLPEAQGSGGLRSVASDAAIGGEYLTMPCSRRAVSRWAVWSSSLEGGAYEVWAYLPKTFVRSQAPRTLSARYEVRHSLGTTIVTVDQTVSGWVRLGSWGMSPGLNSVLLSDLTGETDATRVVVVDAVKWVRLGATERVLGSRGSAGSAPDYPAVQIQDSSYEWLEVWSRRPGEEWVSGDLHWTLGSRATLWTAAVLDHPAQPAWLYTAPEQIDAWVDWNGDHQWSEAEHVLSASTDTGLDLGLWLQSPEEGVVYYPRARDISVPTSAKVGETWMRVKLSYGEAHGGPADPADFGQVTDVKITLEPMADAARSALLVAPLRHSGADSRGPSLELLQEKLQKLGYQVETMADTAANIQDLEAALKRGQYRFLYLATAEAPDTDGSLVIETFSSEPDAQSRLQQLQFASYDTGPENPEVVLRLLRPGGDGENRWALCVTPAFVRHHVPRLWDTLVLCEGFEPFQPDARPFTEALIDQGAYLVAGWQVPIGDDAAVRVAAELLARLSAGKPFEDSLAEVGTLPLSVVSPVGSFLDTTVADLFTFEPILHGDYELTLGTP